MYQEQDEQPHGTCRFCDCVPCACGRQDFSSDAEQRQQQKAGRKVADEDPWAPSTYPGPGAEEGD